jgi:hypothetical protein
MRWRAVLCAGILLTCLCPAAGRAEQPSLPSFRVVGPDGAATDSQTLGVAERWLLIYLVPGSEDGGRYLRSLKRANNPALSARSLLLVGGDAAMGRAFLEGHLPAELQGLPWYADPAGEAWQALGLHGAPVILGIHQGRIEWAISGVLTDPRTFESAIRSWLEY